MDKKLTIVGPEPTSLEKNRIPKKVNIEALLLMAKYDSSFREELISNRDKALAESGLNFTPGEKLILANISDEQLSEDIKEFRVPGITKKSLFNWAKAGSVVLLLSSIALSCSSPFEPDDTLGNTPDDPIVKGSTPDIITSLKAPPDHLTSRGITPNISKKYNNPKK